MGENVQAYASIVVNVWMEHFRHEANFRSFIWVVLVELDDQIEDSALPNGIIWPENDGFPLEEGVPGWRGLNAVLGIVVVHLLQVLEKSALCVRTHLIYFINYNFSLSIYGLKYSQT